MPGHTPVLFPEVFQYLQLQPNDEVIDATLGGGGHARGLLAAVAPHGRVLGIEADERTLEATVQEITEPRLVPAQGNFRDLGRLAQAHGFAGVAGVLFDLGLSSIALADAQRGFSFQLDGPLDMRFDQSRQTSTAAELIANSNLQHLIELFRNFGEERMARPIAEAIIESRDRQPLLTTVQLADLVASVKHRHGARHPATQVFQALRMAVNDELGTLQAALPQALDLLRPGGRMAIITFHSIEDRTVKQWAKAAAADGRAALITKHVVVPSRIEQQSNPRSRSAKLRIIGKPTT